MSKSWNSSPASAAGFSGSVSLWSKAPAWRRTVIAACVLTLCAIGLPFLAAAPPVQTDAKCQPPEATWCGIRPGPLSLDGSGRVLKILEAGETAQILRATAKCLHADVAPSYLPLTRAAVERSPGDKKPAPVVVALPAGMTVQAGDTVEYRGAYTDSDRTCHYVPALVTRVLPPAGGATPAD